jgi:leader peptidase (prepilin peptidase)/N-methyltransferase
MGSFVNVVVYRLPEGESVVHPPSRCPFCRQRLRWWQLIPVFSFLWLQGRCAYCRQRISWRYPATELLFGGALMVFFRLDGLTADTLTAVLFFGLLYTAAAIDLVHRIIPNQLTLFGMVTGLVLANFTALGCLNSIAGLAAGAGSLLLVLLVARRGMGGGDIKLAGVLGAFLGWQGVLLAVFLAALLGSVVGIAASLLRGLPVRRASIPFGPFLSLGGLIAYFFGDRLINWYLTVFIY